MKDLYTYNLVQQKSSLYMQIHEQVQTGRTYCSFIMGRVPILQTNLLLMERGSGFQNVFGLYFLIPEGQNPPAVHQMTWTCSYRALCSVTLLFQN